MSKFYLYLVVIMGVVVLKSAGGTWYESGLLGFLFSLAHSIGQESHAYKPKKTYPFADDLGRTLVKANKEGTR